MSDNPFDVWLFKYMTRKGKDYTLLLIVDVGLGTSAKGYALALRKVHVGLVRC